MRDLVWVDTPEGLDALIKDAGKYSTVALDAEMDSFFVYHTKLCLLQLSCGATDYLVDSLALKDLRALNVITTDPGIRKVVHAGQNDIPFYRGRGVTLVNIFDTHLASKLLGLETHSLAGLVELFFGVSLSKDQQRTDWRVRPLSSDQIAYARQDTEYLNGLASLLDERISQEEGLLLEAKAVFKSLEGFQMRQKEPDVNGWLKIKGATELKGEDRNVLAALFAWRDAVADEQDQALFRIASSGELLALARKRFAGPNELADWVRSDWMRRDARKLVDLMARARLESAPPIQELRSRRRDGLSPKEQEAFERLRLWRNEESKRLDVDPERVLSNRELKVVAKRQPRMLEELAGLEGIEPWRLAKFSGAILDALKPKG